jgi:heat shock protein HtpX
MNQFYNNVKTAVLLGLMTALILGIGSMFGSNGLTIALMMAVVMNVASYFFSDKIAIASARGVEVGPEHPLYQIVERLVQRAGLPMPRVYVSPMPAPNAFATGRNPSHAAVCATQGLLDILDRNEIAGVMGHELAHVKHRDILIVSVAATIAAAISYLGYFARSAWRKPAGTSGGHAPEPHRGRIDSSRHQPVARVQRRYRRGRYRRRSDGAGDCT